jgi:NH3-dependent NAD+ synthetase/predicted amidohydrolase/intein/homing endonuclease
MYQLNQTVGDLEGNSKKIIDIIEKEKLSKAVNMLIFPELAIIGYPPLDLLDKSAFINGQLKYIDKICHASNGCPSLIVLGACEINPGIGRDLFNSALVIFEGKIIYRYHKRLLPTYDIFDEARYFEPGKIMGLFNFKKKRIGIVICEDLWYQNKFYTINPAQELFNAGADFILSLNASPSVVGKLDQKIKMVQEISTLYGLPILYVNQVGGNDDIVFDGNSFITNEIGVVVAQATSFKEDTIEVTEDALYEHSPGYAQGVKVKHFENDAQFFYEQAICGIKDYVKKCNFNKVVIGESGGIDSAVVTALAAGAIGGENVFGITMPSEYSSEGSYKDSELLCANFGVKFDIYPIKDPFSCIMSRFNHIFGEVDKSGLAEENLQARIRGQILMTYSNRYGHLVLSTGNKSELSVGYCVMGDSYIRNSLGLLTAEELFEKLPANQVTYLGNTITNGFQSIKKDRYIVLTEIGNELATSNDHEYKIYDPYKKLILFKKAEKMSVGDLLVLKIGTNVWGTETTLPEFKYKKKKWDYKSFEFKPPQEFTEELSTFLGVCIADGTYVGSYKIRSSKQYVADFCLKFLGSIGLPDSCYRQTPIDENGCFFIEISSVQFLAWLNFLGIKHGSLIKDVPKIVRQAPKVIIQAFIGGLLLDSSTNSNKDRSEICYHSGSALLAKQVHQIFINLGILSFFRVCTRAGYNNMYEVYIPPYETYKLCGIPILKKAIKDRISTNLYQKKLKSSIDYLYGMEEDIMYIKEHIEEHNRGTLRRVLRKPLVRIRRQTLKKYVGMLPDQDSKKRSILEKINTDEYILPCTAIKHETGEYIMYDFSVNNIHEFNANGIDVHNCTIHGDMAGGLAPISDLYKMEVYAVAKYINKLHGKDMIPQVIIDKEPSAELAPNQKDTDNLPPYPVLDAILKYIIEGDALSVEEANVCRKIMEANSQFVEKVLRLIGKAEFKRRQAAITIKMHHKAFGYGRRVPIANKWHITY